MKSFFRVCVLFAAIPALVSTAGAAQTADIDVTVTIQNLSISISANTWPIGTVTVSSTTQMTEANDITVTNDGNVDEDFTLELTDPVAWTAAAAPAPNVYTMSGLFCGAGDAPAGADFNAEDVLTTATQTSTAAIFGYAGGSADGVSVGASSSVDLWLEFQSPTSSGSFVEQTIVVTVGAVAS
jgi:hypothetical protein